MLFILHHYNNTTNNVIGLEIITKTEINIYIHLLKLYNFCRLLPFFFLILFVMMIEKLSMINMYIYYVSNNVTITDEMK